MATTTTEDNKELVHEYMTAWDDADPEAMDLLRQLGVDLPIDA